MKYRLIDSGSSGQGWSMYGSFIQCMQKGAWKNPHIAKNGLGVSIPNSSESETIIERDETGIAMPLKRGSVLHAGIAHLNAARMVYEGRDTILRSNEAYYSPYDAMGILCKRFGLDAVEAADLFAVFDAYDRHYKYDPWQPLGVELFVEFKVAGYRYTMRIDLVVRDTVTGKVFMVDTKTSFKISGETNKKYTLSGQFVALDLIGQKLYGSDFGGTYTNLLPSSLLGAMAGKSPDAMFKRIRRPPTPALDKTTFYRTIGDIGNRIDALVAEGRDIDAWPKALHENICITSYGECEFFERCQWG